MTIIVTATRGGAGATVVTASIALAGTDPAVLVDLAGDLAAALGIVDDAIGVGAWLSSDAPVHRLDELLVPVDGHEVALLPWGRDQPPGHDPARTPERWTSLAAWCARRSADGTIVAVDAGRHAARLCDDRLGERARPAIVVVTRACYLALRRGAAQVRTTPPDIVVLVDEPGRTLGTRDVERTLGAPVAIAAPWDVDIARAIDSGLATVSLPAGMRRIGRAVHRALDHADVGAAL